MTGRPIHFRARTLRSGFTLIELVVVVGIIILLVAIAVPAIGPALSSNHQTQAIQTLTNAITIAQIRAQNRGGYAIRIERAFKTDSRGYMVDANGQTRDGYYSGGFDANTAPVWLDHQQIRFLNPPKEMKAYRPGLDDVIALPANIWVAPDYALSTVAPLNTISNFFMQQNVIVPPSPSPASTRYNPFDTFCIVFDQSGNVTPLRPAVGVDNYQYYDDTQPTTTGGCPTSPHVYPSARGVIMYDRRKFEQFSTVVGRASYLAREGRPFYINRFLGTLVEGRTQ